MKLTLLLVLVFASVALLRAEEIVEDVEEQDEPSMNDLLDGSLDDEVLGNEEDPGHRKHKRMMRRLGGKRVCGRVFIGCLRKTKARCSLVPVCKVHYFACRCIIKVAKKCIGFLKWLKRVVRRHRRRHGRKHGRKHRHDEIEEDEDEDAKRRRRRRVPGFVRKCKGGYKRCSKGKKFCGPCLKAFGGCIKKHAIKHFCNKHGHSKKHDEEDDEETTMANAVENDDNDEIENEEDEADARHHRHHRRRHRKLSAAQKRCAKSGYRCMLKARLNCRRQGRCVRRAMRCFRRVRRRRARKHRKQKHDE